MRNLKLARTMDPNQFDFSSLRLASYNLHGFNQGIPMLNYLCYDYKSDVIFVQEHWFPPFDLNKIQNFSNDFTSFGISAMEDRVESDVLFGRPYGGVCILLNNRYVRCVKFVFCAESFVVLQLKSIVLVNLYMFYECALTPKWLLP